MEAITLINPKGEKREMSNVAFHELQLQYAKSRTFQKWSNEKNISGWVGKGNDVWLSPSVVNKFLKELGYQSINNLHDGKNTGEGC